MKPIAFASEFSLIDHSSGAALATAQALEFLAAQGFPCQAFCSARLDFTEEVCLEQSLADLHLPYQAKDTIIDGHRARMVFTRTGATGVPPVPLLRGDLMRSHDRNGRRRTFTCDLAGRETAENRQGRSRPPSLVPKAV